MNKTNNGGPAFPLQSIGPEFAPGYAGMSLRDYFAGQVLIGLSVRREGRCNADDAENAYALADAMLAARKGGDDASK
jgi:hypothetical protein